MGNSPSKPPTSHGSVRRRRPDCEPASMRSGSPPLITTHRVKVPTQYRRSTYPRSHLQGFASDASSGRLTFDDQSLPQPGSVRRDDQSVCSEHTQSSRNGQKLLDEHSQPTSDCKFPSEKGTVIDHSSGGEVGRGPELRHATRAPQKEHWALEKISLDVQGLFRRRASGDMGLGLPPGDKPFNLKVEMLTTLTLVMCALARFAYVIIALIVWKLKVLEEWISRWGVRCPKLVSSAGYRTLELASEILMSMYDTLVDFFQRNRGFQAREGGYKHDRGVRASPCGSWEFEFGKGKVEGKHDWRGYRAGLC